MARATTAQRSKAMPASELNDRDREFWKAIISSKTTSFTEEELMKLGASLGLTERTTARRMQRLRANGKLSIKHLYNVNAYKTRPEVRAKKANAV